MPEQQVAELQRAILEEARRILVADGYRGLTMRRIAGAVGCTATSIYLYFRGKDDLVQDLIDEGMEALHDRLVAASEAASDPAERLRALCRAYVEFGLGNAEIYEVMFTLHADRMERYPADRYRRARRSLELIAELLDPEDAAGGSSARERMLRATLVWSSLHGVVALLLAGRVDASVDRERLVEAAVENAVRGADAPAPRVSTTASAPVTGTADSSPRSKDTPAER